MTSLALGWLQKLAEALHNDLTAINDTQSAECVAGELRMAYRPWAVVGIVSNEGVLDQIFREFCIGTQSQIASNQFLEEAV